MEAMLQGLVIIGGLTFSLAASLLVEELIFGRIVRLAFVRRRTNEFPVPGSQFSVPQRRINREQMPRANTEN
ncbi:MAG: hypothetical protein WCC32_05125 [Terriglobales bacterium]